MLRSIVTAIRTLTILPVPGKDTDKKENTLPWFPLVGWLLGLFLYGLARLFNGLSGNWIEGTAAILVTAGVVLTRGIHMDGLADWADGFGGGKNKSHVLSIMKDSNVGAFGILAVILVLLLKYISLLRIIHMGFIHLLIPVYIISRMAMVPLAVILPYAREKGGTADPFVKNANIYHFIGAILIGLILLFAFSGIPGWILIAPGCVVTFLMGIWFWRKLNGVTGDLLGATCEMTETVLLFFCATMGTGLGPHFAGGGFLSWTL